MTIVHCPRCRDEVTAPAGATVKTLVRCPLCLEEYVLGEAVGELPPALIVLDGSAEGDELELVGAGAPAGEGRAGGEGEYRLSGGGFERAFAARPSGSSSVAARPAVKGERPKRKERSAVLEVVKVVGGGVVGCTLALAVLWWGLGRDDFKLGPMIAPYAPWIVPAKFHGKPAGGDTSGNSTAAISGDGTGSSAGGAGAAGSGGANHVNGGLGGPTPGTGGLVADLPTDVPFPTPVAPGDPLTIEDPLAGSPSGDASKGSAKKQGVKGSGSKVAKGAATPGSDSEPDLLPPNPAPFNPNLKPESAPNETPAPPEKPLPTADDFAAAVLAAADGFAKVNDPGEQSREKRQKLYTEMYLAASEAGRIVTYLSTADADLSDHVETLKTFLTALARQPGKVSALKSLTDLNLPKRKHDEGVLVAAVVHDIQAAGSMFECLTQSGRSLAETPVVCAQNPQDFCQPGDELLILGRVVENPRKNIPGYEGDHERVVLYGYSVLVPKAEPSP